jgi:hypothetical protein
MILFIQREVSDLNYNYNYDYNFGGLNPDGLAAFGAAALAVILIFAIIGIALAVLQIIGMYKLLKRGDKHPVGAFVPLVGQFQLMELSGMNPWWLLIMMCIGVLNIVPILGFLCCIAAIIYFMIIYCSGIAKSYGKEGAGFVVGLVLLHPIFIFILGIGNNEYVGPKPAKDFLFNKEGKAPTE